MKKYTKTKEKVIAAAMDLILHNNAMQSHFFDDESIRAKCRLDRRVTNHFILEFGEKNLNLSYDSSD